MEILVGNVVYVKTDQEQYVRLAQIGLLRIEPDQDVPYNKLHAIVNGADVVLAIGLTRSEAEAAREEIIAAQYKYTNEIRLVTRYAYAGPDKLVFVGTHYESNAATNDPNWSIIKYTRQGPQNQLMMEQGPLVGAWDDRETLPW